MNLGLGDRGERLDPCAVGIRLRPSEGPPWSFEVVVTASLWLRKKEKSDDPWQKRGPVETKVSISIPDVGRGVHTAGRVQLSRELNTLVGLDDGYLIEVEVEVERARDDSYELAIQLVNRSPEKHPVLKDLNLYETSLQVLGLRTLDFLLESLPDSFRYNRRIPAYGINCGVSRVERGFVTRDVWQVDRKRPSFWSHDVELDLSFSSLSDDPFPSLERLAEELDQWGASHWDVKALEKQATDHQWSKEMRTEAAVGAEEFACELERIRTGIGLLRTNSVLLRAFKLMNKSFMYSARSYEGWRAFQVGFLLANLEVMTEGNDPTEVADIVWFATGGGKTETYLGLIVLGALFDRIHGKVTGVSAWSRFPLRMLSLQQTQRFANAMAGAERVRREEGLVGDSFSVGFLVGRAATPNSIALDPKEGEFNVDDEEEAAKYQVLLHCPFCDSTEISMLFDRRNWRLEHRCRSKGCFWGSDSGLPFFVVDDEIYRFLPTVVVGTLDKAALVAFQASMRGLLGPPHGVCSIAGHGYVYATRSSRPNGCLVPGCRGIREPLPMEASDYGPRFRLQDELHLLKDSLGAVDSHYESLLDSLQLELTGRTPKILASSATLAGFRQQSRVLYDRDARAFPTPPPLSGTGFWMSDTSSLQRRFVGVAPRGTTLEYATDRVLTELQKAVRRLATEASVVCQEAGIDLSMVPELLSLYGVDVVYGNALRDLDAVARSLESQQVRVDGPLNTAQLTGRTSFEDVRTTLTRLEEPEESFEDRLHVITASSMMSHGVDIDRLNVMVMLGLPLTTAEFIQTTARVGRRWPGLVFVIHKIGRERDAGVYRSFPSFVRQGDRFVEPVPITRRSRRVLERTIAGLQLSRILLIHEPSSGMALTTVRRLRQYFAEAEIDREHEALALMRMLSLDEAMDEPLRQDVVAWIDQFFRNLEDPGGTFKWPSDLCPLGPPMMSLRDVEEQALVRN